MARSINLKLTQHQAQSLSFILSINAHRDIEKEIKAWTNLAESGLTVHTTDEQREEFARKAASNRDFCIEQLKQLDELRAALHKARALA